MKKSCFLKCFCLILLLFSGVFFVSCKDNSKPENKVSDITIESKFFSTNIYQNTQVDLSNFKVYISNTIDEDETFTLSQLYGKSLDTSKVGTHSFLLSYKDFTKAFDYEVLPVTMVAARYNGEPIKLFLHEGANISTATFLALYSDGTEEKIQLSEATFSFDNLEVSNEIKTTTAIYNGFTFNIEYVVKTREVQQNTEYSLIDQSNYFQSSKQLYATLTENKLTVYTKSDGVSKVEYTFTVSASSIINEYETNQVFAAQGFVKFKIFLTADGLVLEQI